MFRKVMWIRIMGLAVAWTVGFTGIGFAQDEMNPFDTITSQQVLFNTASYGLKGPIQELRSEVGGFMIDITTLGWKEANRNLDLIYRFDAQGFLLEEENYEMSGMLIEKMRFQHENGRSIMQSIYDPVGNPLRTYEYIYDEEGILSEQILKSVSGALMERWEYTYGDVDSVILHYGSSGELLDRFEIRNEGTTIETKTLDGSGNLVDRTVMVRNGNQQELTAYDENNEFMTHVIQFLDDDHKIIEVHSLDENGVLTAKNLYKYEDYDVYGNWTKLTESMVFLFDEELGEDSELPIDISMDSMPLYVEYRIFTYHTAEISNFSIY